jgi:DnaJ-class molecular chaperone
MDLYTVLGIPRSATPEDIKKAYKKQAMRHHPDRGGNPDEFRKVTEAYDVLSNSDKRSAYDNPQPGFSFNSQDFAHGNPFAGTPFDDMFRRRQTPRNKDIQMPINVTLKDVLTGNRVAINYQLSTGRIETVTIDIPPGARNGDKIQYEGLGDEGNRNYPRGSLIVHIRIKKNKSWIRDGDNLTTKKFVNLFDFLTGGAIIITTLDNKTVKLNIPQGTPPGTTFSISGYGIPNLNTRRPGNLFVKLEANMPKNLDTKLLEEIENLKRKIG